MFPYVVLAVDDRTIQQTIWRSPLTGRDKAAWADTTHKESNHALSGMRDTNQSIFFVDSEADGQDLLSFLAKNNPSRTWMLFTSLALAKGIIDNVTVKVDKFDKNGKLPS